jgi:hypothetical protein
MVRRWRFTGRLRSFQAAKSCLARRLGDAAASRWLYRGATLIPAAARARILQLVSTGERARVGLGSDLSDPLALRIYACREAPVLKDSAKFLVLLGGEFWTDSTSLSLRDFSSFGFAKPATLLVNAQAVVEAVFGATWTSGMFEGLLETVRSALVDLVHFSDMADEDPASNELWLCSSATLDHEHPRFGDSSGSATLA